MEMRGMPGEKKSPRLTPGIPSLAPISGSPPVCPWISTRTRPARNSATVVGPKTCVRFAEDRSIVGVGDEVAVAHERFRHVGELMVNLDIARIAVLTKTARSFIVVRQPRKIRLRQ